jgi:NTP pyrophosphatase (non-canonical NTP hydrolase)
VGVQEDAGEEEGGAKMLSSMPSVLLEEAGEVARAVLEKDHDNLQVELVQVAAVCVKWLEIILNEDSLRRKNSSCKK